MKQIRVSLALAMITMIVVFGISQCLPDANRVAQNEVPAAAEKSVRVQQTNNSGRVQLTYSLQVTPPVTIKTETTNK